MKILKIFKRKIIYLCIQINGWIRKANQCNYQLVAIPADPMAEPFTEKSDPLRGPIFIPLSVNFLNNDDNLFEGFSYIKIYIYRE